MMNQLKRKAILALDPLYCLLSIDVLTLGYCWPILQVYISSTKSMMGHTLGAAGGLEAIVCAQVLRHGEIPPTMNLENPALEDGCDLNYCPGKKVGRLRYDMIWCGMVWMKNWSLWCV